MPPIKLSVVIITFNEENNIERCLNSIKEVADEIVVLDSYSSDKTADICKHYNAIFIQHKFLGHIEQKNKALSHAKYDYVLSLDADESLSPELSLSIQKIKKHAQHKAYNFNRLTFYENTPIKTCGWYPDTKIRLWNTKIGKWGGINPHDKVILEKSIRVKHLDGDLFHYSFSDFKDYLNRQIKYARITAQAYHQENERFYLFKLLVNPSYRFIRDYFFNLGFTEGVKGLMICSVASFAVFLKYYNFFLIKNQQSTDIEYKPTVLHFSSEKGWRGGERQIIFLIEELNKLETHNTLVCKPHTKLYEIAQKKGIDTYCFNFRNIYNPVTWFKFKKITKKLNATLIHIHTPKAHTLVAFSYLVGLKIPSVLSKRTIFKIKSNPLTHFKYNHSQIKATLCVSNAIEAYLKSQLKHPDRIKTIHSGINLTKYQISSEINSLRDQLGISQDAIIVGNTAALSYEKGYNEFIQVAKKVINKNKDIHFVALGEGRDRKTLEAKIIKENLTHNIHLLGFRSNADLLLKQFSIFFIPSLFEGLGSSILDAFAQKVPVVSSNVGGIPELVIHNKTGFSADYNDVKSHVSHIFQLIESAQLRDRLTEQASLHLLNFTKEQMAKKTYDVYQEVLKAI